VSVGGPLDRLKTLSLDELRAEWRQRFASAPPKLRTRELLALALGYRLQAASSGGLSATSRRRVAELARRFAKDRNYSPAPGPVLKAGSAIVREWRGVRYEVRVLEEGFSYEGARFGSLSEVARHITGTKWNGHVFFGLKGRRQ
jgi:hypothetical protein